MTPDRAREIYRNQMTENGGEWMTIIHATDTTQKYKVRGRPSGFAPSDLGAGIVEGSRKVIVLAEDLDGTKFADALGTGGAYKIQLADGDYLNIESVDSNTCRLNGVVVAYLLDVLGI